MRWQFITKYTNICNKHHNIHITVSKPAKMIKTVEKMNDNNNEGDSYKIAEIIYAVVGDLSDIYVWNMIRSLAAGRHFVRLPSRPTVNRTGCHK